MKRITRALALSAFASAATQSAYADQWSNILTPVPPAVGTFLGVGQYVCPSSAQAVVTSGCATYSSTQPPININQFANQADVVSLQSQSSSLQSQSSSLQTQSSSLQSQISSLSSATQAQIASLQSQFSTLQNQLIQTQHMAFQGAAMAAALTAVMPANGDQNHLGLGLATVGNQQAVSVNYTRVQDNFDLEAGASFSGAQALGKVGFGVSW